MIWYSQIDLPIIAMPMILLDLLEPMDEFATKIPEVQIAAKKCVAIVDGKQFRRKSRNDANASFIGVATWSVKLVQKMSNLQSVNKFTKSVHNQIFFPTFVLFAI